LGSSFAAFDRTMSARLEDFFRTVFLYRLRFSLIRDRVSRGDGSSTRNTASNMACNQ